MIEKAYFVSDLHLGSDKEPKCFLFAQFLDSVAAERPRYLFLLGDIFDMWLADHSIYEKRYQSIIDRMKKVKDAGTEVHFFEGNHDLFLEHYFEKKMGFKVHKGPLEIKLFGKHVRLEHGDQMDPDDKGYIFLRWFLRTPVLNWLAPRVPSALVQQIGDRGSELSREHSRGQAQEVDHGQEQKIREKIRKHVQKEASQLNSEFELFISGHMHVEDDFTFEIDGRQVRSINLGTWLKRPVVLEVTAQSVRLMDLNNNPEQFKS